MPQITPLYLNLPTQQHLKESSYGKIKGPQLFVNLVQHARQLSDIRQGYFKLIEEKHYTAAGKASLFWYRLHNANGTYDGFLCGIPPSAFKAYEITTHEYVLDQRVLLFTDYLKQTHIQAEPLLIVHENESFDQKISTQICNKKPDYTYTISGEKHELWHLNVQEQNDLEAFALKEKYFHLADGHHRLASSLKLMETAPSNHSLQCLVMLNKKVNKNGFCWKIKQLPQGIDLEEKMCIIPPSDQKNEIKIQLPKQTYYLKTPEKRNPASYIFEELLGFSSQKAIDLSQYIDYIPRKDVTPSPSLPLQPPYIAEINFRPLYWTEILSYAKKHKKLPPKSTYLLPKISTGLFISPI